MYPIPVISFFFIFASFTLFSRALSKEEHRHRLKRAAAVWGASAPDYYSLISLPSDDIRYLTTILFVDSKIMEYYDNDFIRTKSKVLHVVEEANRYLVQLNVALIVLDILPMMRSDFSLYSFQEFRNQRLAKYNEGRIRRVSNGPFPQLHKLPDHDFAVLFTFKYAGGLAFVDGMCSPQSVMLCGFFPSEPKAMGGIFFHEMAHLLGVPHKPLNSSIEVPDCACETERPKRSIISPIVTPDHSCLRIPGFDHDCTAQQFVNYLHTSRCVRTEIEFPMRSQSICGNRVLEEGEECDCGIEEVCTRWNCHPQSCTYKINPAILWFLAVVLSFLLFSLFSFLLHRRGLLSMFTSCYKKNRSKGVSAYSSTLLTDDILKGSEGMKKRKGGDYSTHVSQSVVVLLDRPPRVPGLPSPLPPPLPSSRFSPTFPRPIAPPPPPPKTKIAVQSANNHGYEIPTRRNGHEAPHCSAEPDSISWKFDSFDSDEEDVITVPSETGVPCRPHYPFSSPINRIVVASIPSESEATLSTDCPSSSSSFDTKM